jgi:hypothetical protein
VNALFFLRHLHRCGVAIVALGLLAGAGPSTAEAGGPDEETWSIRCITLQGANRADMVKRYLDALKKAKGIKAKLVETVQDPDGTAVFYGRYQREYNSKGEGAGFKPDPKQDLELIRSFSMRIKDEAGQSRDIWPFYLATMDILPTFKSQHPEWNLANADGYWALHVAVFYNTSEFRNRRTAAEQYCALLREKGEQAWYHHATVNSSVYIGPYPKEAVAEIHSENALKNQVTNKLRIVDPRMLEAQKRYPTSIQNGSTIFEIRRDREGQIKDRVPSPSFVVMMPKAEQQEAAAAGKTEPGRPRPGNERPAGW